MLIAVLRRTNSDRGRRQGSIRGGTPARQEIVKSRRGRAADRRARLRRRRSVVFGWLRRSRLAVRTVRARHRRQPIEKSQEPRVLTERRELRLAAGALQGELGALGGGALEGGDGALLLAELGLGGGGVVAGERLVGAEREPPLPGVDAGVEVTRGFALPPQSAERHAVAEVELH